MADCIKMTDNGPCGKPILSRGMCAAHYRREQRGSESRKPIKQIAEQGSPERWIENLVTQWETGHREYNCIEWPYGVSHGLPVHYVDRKPQYVRRTILRKLEYKLPIRVRWTCDNPGCVNPGCAAVN